MVAGCSEQANHLLLTVLLPLLEGVPLISGHLDVASELLVAQVVFLLRRCDTRWEARFEYLVGELVRVGVELASESVVGDSGGLGLHLCFFSFSCCDYLRIGFEPLSSNLGLPLDELNSETGRLTTSEDLGDDNLVLVSLITQLLDVLFSTCHDTLLLELVRLVADPGVDSVEGIEDVAVVVQQVFLSEARNFLHPHEARGVRYGEEAWFETRSEANLLLHLAVLALSTNTLPELS